MSIRSASFGFSRFAAVVLEVLAACWLMFLSATLPLRAADLPTQLQVDTPLSKEGYFVLQWQLPALASRARGDSYSLQEADNPDFDNASAIAVAATGSMTLTGYRDGNYYYRAGVPGQWSNAIQVEVSHHALSRAWLCFVVGLILFAVLCTVIARGAGSEQPDA